MKANSLKKTTPYLKADDERAQHAYSKHCQLNRH
jgi:hypothetical protein